MYDVLERASTDCDLAHFLRECAVQYRDDMEPILEWRMIAQASVKYIQVGASEISKIRRLVNEYLDWHLSSGVEFHSLNIRTRQI
jgi:hypothetical protein